MYKNVLTINRQVLQQQGIPKKACGLYPFDIYSVDVAEFQFIHRKIVDDPEQKYFKTATQFPQLLVYCVITHQDKVLTYSRSKGTESQLQKHRSIGFGGHADLMDYHQLYSTQTTEPTPVEVLNHALYRELHEELGLSVEELPKYEKVVVDVTNAVGAVHIGLVHQLHIDNITDISVNLAEIADPQWKTIEELKKDMDQYETWSQLLIQDF